MLQIIAWIVLGMWLYLIVGRGGFWLVRADGVRDEPPPPAWPRVTVVIPARNEAATVGTTVRSILAQDYPIPIEVVLVDDDSDDGTADAARAAAAEADAEPRLTVVRGCPLPRGWTGKVWAQRQGVDRAATGRPDYLLLTDADITYAPDGVRRLVSRAVAGGLVLTSIMAKLNCESLAERFIIPAFIFFFRMLYPFAWVNQPARRTAAAAGGCMLVRADALAAAGGIESIRDALIDDCALARRLKRLGPISLDLSERVRSLRACSGLGPLRHMVTRSAYAQLGYSPALLVGTVAAMAIIFLAPPLLAVAGSGVAAIVGAVAYALMVVAFQPILRFYRVSPLWGFALPAIALVYTAWTVESGIQYALGRGGVWKGRVQATPSSGAL
jgi:hopene-associated glycosyltransferase HpnB